MSLDHEAQCAELYRIGELPADIPDGLLVIGTTTCIICKQGMRNNDYCTATKDGTPITWLNCTSPDGNVKFYATPGVSYDNEQQVPIVGGSPMAATPIVVFVRNNTVVTPSLKYGEIAEGEFETILEKARAQGV